MGLDEIRHALEASARHAEGSLARHGVEIRLARERGPIELDNPLEGCEAEIGTPWPELGLMKENVLRENQRSERGVALEGGTFESSIALEGGAAERGVSDKDGAGEPGYTLEGGADEHSGALEDGGGKCGIAPEGGADEPGNCVGRWRCRTKPYRRW